jgi:hypothetical protein
MLWIALLASLQEPSRWDFKPGSWADFSYRSLERLDDPSPRVFRDEPRSSVGRPGSFTEGLREISRRPDVWRNRACVVVEYRGERRFVRAWIVEGLSIPARDMPAVPRLAAVPADVVKVERAEGIGTTELTSTLEVQDLHAKVEAAGRTFDCVLETSMSVHEMADGRRCLRSKRRWLSAEVPGHVVRQDRQCTDRPDAVPHAYSSRDELKAFHVER